MKKPASKVAHNRPQVYFQYCQPAQNQPKTNPNLILFHKNGSLCNFYIMTLSTSVVTLKKTTTFQFGHHSAKTAFGESADLNSKVHCPLGSMSLAQLALLL